MKPFRFRSPLIEGILLKRISQFTMSVIIKDEVCRCHCCTSETIGNIDLYGRPCLLSVSSDSHRNTAYTVEALSLNDPMESDKSWIGINQIAANRYVEHFLRSGDFSRMISNESVHREQQFQDSRIDFLVDDTYLEVKTPLQNLQTFIPYHVHTKPVNQSSRHDRLIKHMDTLAKSLTNHPRAIMLLCFIYDNPGFRVHGIKKYSKELRSAFYRSMMNGVELWQANFNLSPDGVMLNQYFQLDSDRFRDYQSFWF